MHIRKQFRDAVIEKLSGTSGIALACPASRVSREFQKNEFPFAAVNVSESLTPIGKGPAGMRQVERLLSLSVSLAVRVTDASEDELDALSVIVEPVLLDYESLGVGAIKGWSHDSSSYTTISGEYELSVLELTYSGSIYTLESDPETNLH